MNPVHEVGAQLDDRVNDYAERAPSNRDNISRDAGHEGPLRGSRSVTDTTRARQLRL